MMMVRDMLLRFGCWWRGRPLPARAVIAMLALTGLLLGLSPLGDSLAADLTRYRPAALPKTPSVPGKDVKASSASAGKVPIVTGRSHTRWPTADAVKAESVDAGAQNRPSVEVFDQKASEKAGRRGVLMRLTRPAGAGAEADAVRIRVNYGEFRDLYGADWASRLRLVRLPECALTTPGAAECQGTPIPSGNDGVGSVTGEVDVGKPVGGTAGATPGRSVPQLLASESSALVSAEASPSGSAGDYSATPVAASSTWRNTGSTGAFVWSYPISAPPAVSGLRPNLTLGYSSQSVDGRTAATNNQPSWLGEGFDLPTGFIERHYKSCNDDMAGGSNTTKNGDLCWGNDNAVMSLGGESIELVRDDVGGDWHPREDTGARIEHLTEAVNGDNNGEYWRVTTTDGTQYWFGRNRLPGWSEGRAETNSTWTVPVFGNQAGEPCQQATFDTSSCQQAWRWNLDYIVNVHGDSMSWWYQRETNRYARNLDPANNSTDYTRGGYPVRVDYGTRTDAEYGTVGARVYFDVADRCLPNVSCDPTVVANRKNWPDTPWDQWCQTGESCTGRYAPTFWSSKRLARVRTQVWDAATGAFRDVDSWSFEHTYPEPGDGTRAGLWLSGITRTGLVGGSLSTPKVTLTPVQMNNRVDGLDGAKAMNWSRLQSIRTESGGEITVGYSDRQCDRKSSMPASTASNNLRCFPAYWTPEGFAGPVLDWFHKYVVTAVVETDHTGGAPRVVTTYEYVGDPAWHYDDDDGLTPAKYKTWGQWRGYERVRTRKGDPGEQELTETRYYRGMDGDRTADGGRRSVVVTDSRGGTVTDSGAFAGAELEEIVYSDTGSAVGNVPAAPNTEVRGAIYRMWQSDPTATRAINGTTAYARYVGTATERKRVVVPEASRTRDRTTQVDTTYDKDYGVPVSISDQGDVDVAGDEKCKRTTYARNRDTWLLALAARVEVDAVTCDREPASEKEVISDVRTSFDGGAFGATPTRGDATATEMLTSWTASSRGYVTIGRARHDVHGRAIESWDAVGARTATTYTPAIGGPLTKVEVTTEVTDALSYTSTTQYEPARGAKAASVDANGKRTDFAYDALGRLVKVWLPGRAKASQSPNTEYAYQIQADGPSVVTTKQLNASGAYHVSYQLLDSLLRARQTQSPASGGGRVLTDTFYDSAGRARLTFEAYYNSSSPGTTLFAADPTLVLDQTRSEYDGAGRITASIFQPGGKESPPGWRTTTRYTGDTVTTIPPAGGITSTVVTDAHDRTTELRQYHSADGSGAYDSTFYGYNAKNQLVTVKDPAGNTWTTEYDLRGRVVREVDPDSGATTSTYDDADRLMTTTDAAGRTMAFSYDLLGRKTGAFEGSTTGTKRYEWVYDTVAKGQLSSSATNVNGNWYRTSVLGYTDTYQPTQTVVEIPDTDTMPAGDRKLTGKYAIKYTYYPDGSPKTRTYPNAGGLAEETVLASYTADTGAPSTLKGSYNDKTVTYITASAYTSIGLPQRYERSTGTGKVWQTFAYQPGTNRLAQMVIDRDLTTPNEVANIGYTYDNAGNITTISDTPSGGTSDTQCFRYDYLHRLTEAWTPSSGVCTTAPTPTGLGGAAKYWSSWTFDVTGNRQSQVAHATTSGDVTTTYQYPAAGGSQPHTLTATTTTDSSGTRTASYSYDATGDLTSRPRQTGTQTLAWNPDGHLASVAEGNTTSSYVYGADGERLLSRDATGVTLYLPDTELRLTTATGKVDATRHYIYGGQTVAMRTSVGLTWLIVDHNGTGQIAIDAATQKATYRRLDPYGNQRGTASDWPDSHGFVGGVTDPTGLVHLGAREYDPALGRFISDDPVTNEQDTQQLNGYAYAKNSPVTYSDATGRYPVFSDDGSMKKWTNPADGSFVNTSSSNETRLVPTSRCSISRRGSAYDDPAAKALLGLNGSKAATRNGGGSTSTFDKLSWSRTLVNSMTDAVPGITRFGTTNWWRVKRYGATHEIRRTGFFNEQAVRRSTWIRDVAEFGTKHETAVKVANDGLFVVGVGVSAYHHTAYEQNTPSGVAVKTAIDTATIWAGAKIGAAAGAEIGLAVPEVPEVGIAAVVFFSFAGGVAGGMLGTEINKFDYLSDPLGPLLGSSSGGGNGGQPVTYRAFPDSFDRLGCPPSVWEDFVR